MPTALMRRRSTDDDGLTLIEVIAAIVVFGIAASGLAMGLLYSKKSVRDSRLRIQAANLASRESEIVRNAFTASKAGPANLGATSLVTNPDPLPGGTAGQPLVVDNTPFTVKRTTEWVPSGTGSSACDGGSTVTYPTLAVHIEVSWANMGSTKPVFTNTVLTPPKGTLNSTQGFVAVKVNGATGPVENMAVTLSGASGPFTRNTESDGCTVFAVTTVGSYTATLNTPGYVTNDSQPSKSLAVTVAASSLQVLTFSYDKQATLNITMASSLAGYALPTTLPQITVFNSSYLTPSPNTRNFAASAATTSVTGLWPGPLGYSAWPGSCSASDQAARAAGPGARPAGRSAGVPLTPGVTVNQTIDTAPTLVTMKTAGGVLFSNATIIATPAAPKTGCLGNDLALTLGVTDASGQLKTSLPTGSYVLSTPTVPTGYSSVATATTSTSPSYTAATSYLLTVS